MFTNRMFALAMAIAWVAVAVSVASAATTVPQVSYFLDGPTDLLDSSATGPLSASQTNAHSYGSVAVGFGWARLDASSTAVYSGGKLRQDGAMIVNAGWRDTVTIDGGGLTGTTGTAYGALSITGAASGLFPNVDWESYAAYDVQVVIDGVSQPATSGTWINGTWQDGSLPVTVELPVDFTFGQTFTLEVAIQVLADTNNWWVWMNTPAEGEFATARMDLGHTIEWAGVTKIEDADSNVVYQQGQGSTLTFDSGTATDWTAPVEAPEIPEPATCVLLGAGVLAAIRRHAA